MHYWSLIWLAYRRRVVPRQGCISDVARGVVSWEQLMHALRKFIRWGFKTCSPLSFDDSRLQWRDVIHLRLGLPSQTFHPIFVLKNNVVSYDPRSLMVARY